MIPKYEVSLIYFWLMFSICFAGCEGGSGYKIVDSKILIETPPDAVEIIVSLGKFPSQTIRIEDGGGVNAWPVEEDDFGINQLIVEFRDAEGNFLVDSRVVKNVELVEGSTHVSLLLIPIWDPYIRVTFAGGTITMKGWNFGAAETIDIYINDVKVYEERTDENGHFVAKPSPSVLLRFMEAFSGDEVTVRAIGLQSNLEATRHFTIEQTNL